MPFTHLSASTFAALVRMRIERSTLCAITGIMTLSSSCPCSAAIADGRVAAHDLEADLVHHLGIDGLILPGMIDDPGCTAGSLISSMPVRGPMTMSRRSLAILLRSTASDAHLRAERRRRRPCSA